MNSENLNIEEEGFFEKTKKIFKQLVFNVFSPLLLSESFFSLPFKILFFIIETIQVLSFCFRPQIINMWFNDSWAFKIKDILGYFMLIPYFSLTSYNTYIVFLYVISVLFFWIFMSSIYIGYNFSQKNKKNSKGFLLAIIKLFNELLQQILFLPIFNYFFSFFRCVQNEEGNLVNEIFQNVLCYQGDYILHSLIAGFAFAIFLSYSTINIFCYYEIRNKSFSSKITCQYDLFFLLFKVVLEISFSFLQESQHMILLGIISVGFFIFFLANNEASIYYNDFISRVSVAQHSILCYTGIILVFSKITYDLEFNAYLYLWITGILVILTISFTRIRIKYNNLIFDVDSFEKEEIALKVLDYLIFSLNYYKSDKNIAIALDGFVEYHKTYCKTFSCPSRKDYSTKSIKNATITDNEDKNIILLSHQISSIFFQTLQRFPNSIKLRIKYSIFLLDRMGQKQNALQELLTTRNFKLKFDEEFIVFRLINIIEKDIYEDNTANQRLEFNELFLRDLIKSIQTNIEKSSNLNMEFWNTLSEDCPNLSKLKEIGIKMASLYKLIERSYKILNDMNINIPKIQILYSKYLNIIVQDKEKSSLIFEKLQESNNSNKILTVYFSEYFNDSSPIIIISANDKNLGYITKVSLSLSSALGYTKSELINRKINTLMIPLHANNHDTFLENYITTLEPRIINKETNLPIKTKANYIKKTSILIKLYNTILQGPQFLGMLKFEKTVKQFSYIVCDEKGNILDFSSSSLMMLGIDRKKIAKRKIQISDIIPDFFSIINLLKMKKGMDLIIHVIDKEDHIEKEKSHLLRNSLTTMNVHIVSEIKFKNTETLGFFVRLESKANNNLGNQKLKAEIPQIKVFNMQYDLKNQTYIGNMHNSFDLDGNSNYLIRDLNSNEELNEEEIRFDVKEIVEENQGLKEISMNLKGLGIGFRTLRLVNNKLYDLEELKKEENQNEENEEENEEVEQSILTMKNVQNNEENELDESRENSSDVEARYKSLANFKFYLNDEKAKKFDHLKNMKYVGLVLLISLTIISLVSYFLVKNKFTSRIQDHQFILLSNKRNSEVMTVLNTINQLVLLNNKWISENNYHEENLRAILNGSIHELSSIDFKLQSFGANCPLLSNANITVNFESETNGFFDVSQITSQILSKAFNLLTNTSLDKFLENNPDIKFLRENILQDYHFALIQLSDNCILSLEEKISQTHDLTLTFVIIASLILLLSWHFILYIIFFGILKFEQGILKIFLCLPLEKVKCLVGRSAEFHSQFKLGDVEQNDDDDDSSNRISLLGEEEEEAKEFKVKITKKKRKKYKMETGKYKKLFLYTMIFILSLEAYFLGSFTISHNFISILENNLNEFNITTIIQPNYAYYNNVVREIFLDTNFNAIIEGNLTKDFLISQINVFYDDFYKIQEKHKENSDFLPNYDNYFVEVFTGNSCLFLDTNKLKLNCSEFSSEILTQGMIISLPKYFEDERYIISLWNYFSNNPNSNLDFLNISNVITPNGTDSIKNNLINLFQLPILESTNILQENFIKLAFSYLLTELENELISQKDSAALQNLTLLICFLVLFFCSYFFFWIPFINSLKKDNMETTNLLLVIPLKLIRDSIMILQEIEENFK